MDAGRVRSCVGGVAVTRRSTPPQTLARTGETISSPGLCSGRVGAGELPCVPRINRTISTAAATAKPPRFGLAPPRMGVAAAELPPGCCACTAQGGGACVGPRGFISTCGAALWLVYRWREAGCNARALGLGVRLLLLCACTGAAVGPSLTLDVSESCSCWCSAPKRCATLGCRWAPLGFL